MTIDYPSHLQPEKFKLIPGEVDEEFPRRFPNWVKYSSVIHHRVTANSEYYRSGSNIPPPTEMMKKLVRLLPIKINIFIHTHSIRIEINEENISSKVEA